MNIQEQAAIQRNDVIGDKDHTLFLSEIQVKNVHICSATDSQQKFLS